jgi:hypothetical protein
MKLAYVLPYRVTKLTTLQALQYKILNKIINCNYWLHKIQIIESPKCRYCQKDETIEHIFFCCAVTRQFWWYAFLTWWKVAGNNYPNILDEKDVILGFNLGNKLDNALNCCILIAKKMIYEQKNFHKRQPNIYTFHCDLKSTIEMERQISMKNDKLSEFQEYWGDLVI